MAIAAVIAGIVSVLASILIAVYRHEKNRTAQLQAVADEMGIEFHPKGDVTLTNSLDSLALFSKGRAKRTSNLLRGTTQDLDLAIFGYKYTTGHGKHASTHQQTVVSFQSPGLHLPEFTLCPENLFHRIGQTMGYQDIDFESHPVFSKSYLLRGKNEAAIRSAFTPEVLQCLELLKGISLEGARDRLIFFRANKRIKPVEIRRFMEDGFAVYRLFAGFQVAPEPNQFTS